MALSYAPNLGAYRTAAVHGGVASADPQGLVLMLMNGALERIAKARGCIANKAYAEKAQLIHRTVAIIDELRNSLNLQAGGELAKNLDDLYEYMCRQLLKSTVENNAAPLDEVTKLLTQIRDAWAQLPQQGRK